MFSITKNKTRLDFFFKGIWAWSNGIGRTAQQTEWTKIEKKRTGQK